MMIDWLIRAILLSDTTSYPGPSFVPIRKVTLLDFKFSPEENHRPSLVTVNTRPTQTVPPYLNDFIQAELRAADEIAGSR